jgi:hypothetical protein
MLQFFLGSVRKIRPTSVAGAEAFGTPGITLGRIIYPVAVASMEAVQTALLTHLIQVGSISAGALGSLEIEVGDPVISPRGIGTHFLLFPVRVGTEVFQVPFTGRFKTVNLGGKKNHTNTGRINIGDSK